MDERLSEYILTAAGVLAGLGFAEMLGTVSPKIAAGMIALAILLVLVRYLWLWFPENGRIRLVVLMVGLLLAAVFVKAAPATRFPVPDKNKIHIALQHAAEWDDYMGATHEPPRNRWRKITKPITRTFPLDPLDKNRQRLQLGVFNGNEGASLTNVVIRVHFDGRLVLNHDTENWRADRRNKDYRAELGDVNHGKPKFPRGGSLWLIKSSPGTYSVSYTINGGNFDDISRSFKFNFKKPASDKKDSPSQ